MSPLLSFFAGVVVGGIVIGAIVSRALHQQLRGILAAPGYERAMARACVAARRPSLAPQQGQAPVGGLAGEAERGFAGEAGRGFAGEAGRGFAGEAGRAAGAPPFFTSPFAGEVGAQAPGGGLAGGAL